MGYRAARRPPRGNLTGGWLVWHRAHDSAIFDGGETQVQR